MNDSELLKRLRDREPEAVNVLYERYLPSVWRLVCARVDGDTHLAEDLVNETMLALFKSFNKQSSDEIKSLGGWLHTVANRKVQDHYRAVARVRHLVQTAAENQDVNSGEPQSSEIEIAKERRAEIRELMDSLSDQFRLVLEWKYIDGLSVAAIAERLDVTEKAAESILFRARKAFRERAGLRDLAPQANRVAKEPAEIQSEMRVSLPITKPGLFGGQAE